jgi:ADP-ribose pyrophosphatase
MHRSESGLTEETVTSECVYSGVLLHVRSDRVRLPDGAVASREYIVHPGAAVILPRLPDGRVLFERQYRYPHRRVFIELPAGKREPAEDLLVTAQRELLEETGYRAAHWEKMATIHPIVTYTTEEIVLFLADGLEYVGQQLDHGEFVDTFAASLGEALEWITRGELTDAKTMIALLMLAQRGR